MAQPHNSPSAEELRSVLQGLLWKAKVIQYGVYAPYDIKAKYGAEALEEPGIAIILPFPADIGARHA